MGKQRRVVRLLRLPASSAVRHVRLTFARLPDKVWAYGSILSQEVRDFSRVQHMANKLRQEPGV